MWRKKNRSSFLSVLKQRRDPELPFHERNTRVFILRPLRHLFLSISSFFSFLSFSSYSLIFQPQFRLTIRRKIEKRAVQTSAGFRQVLISFSFGSRRGSRGCAFNTLFLYSHWFVQIHAVPTLLFIVNRVPPCDNILR